MLRNTNASGAPTLASLEDFSSWKVEFVVFLQKKGLSRHLNRDDCYRHSASPKCNTECNRTMSLLQNALSVKIRAACAAARSTSALWEALQQLCKGVGNDKLKHFIKLLSITHSVTPETLCDFILTIETQFSELAQTGTVLDVDFKKAFLFVHLPDEFDTFKRGNWYSSSTWYDFLAELRAYNRDVLQSRAQAVTLVASSFGAADFESSACSSQAVAYCDQCLSYGHTSQKCLLETQFGPMGSMNIHHYMHIHKITPQPHLQELHRLWLENNRSTPHSNEEARRDDKPRRSVSQIRMAQYRTIELTLPMETRTECFSEDTVKMTTTLKEQQQKPQPGSVSENVADMEAVTSSPALPTQINMQQKPSRDEAVLVIHGPGRDPRDTPSLKAAVKSRDREQWKRAIKREISQLVKQGALEIVSLKQAPIDAKPLEFQLEKRRGANGSVDEYRVSLCVSYKMSVEEGYGNPSRPQAKHCTLLTLLHVASYYDWEVHQVSVSSVINNEMLNKPMWLMHSNAIKSFISPGHYFRVKRAPFHPQRVSYQSWVLLRNALLGLNWKQSTADQCLFIRESQHGNEMILVCGDDLVLISSLSGMSVIKTELDKHCNFRDYGETRFLLDIHIKRDRSKRTFSLDQGTLIRNCVNKFHTSPAVEKRFSTAGYQEELACLLHVAQRTRPDLSFAVSRLMRMERERGSAQAKDLDAAWRLLTENSRMGLLIEASTPLELFTYTFLFPRIGWPEGETVMSAVTCLGASHNSWTMFEPIDMTFCTSEEKYVAMVTPSKQAMWLQALYAELIPGAGMLPMEFYCCDQREGTQNLPFWSRYYAVQRFEHTFRLMRSVLADGTEVSLQAIHEKENIPATETLAKSSSLSPVGDTKAC